MIKGLANLFRKLSWLRKIYHRYKLQIIWDWSIIRDLMDYYRLSRTQTVALLRAGKEAGIMLWNSLAPETPEQIMRFYELTPFAVFSGAFWHMRRYQRNFRKQIVASCRGNVLDFGGGIGDLSVSLAMKGFPVTYADVRGRTMDFAVWRFRKKHLPIQVVDVTENMGDLADYDTILCIDVIEHLTEPKEMLVALTNHLKTGGNLIINNLDCSGPSKLNPSHRAITFSAKEILNLQGIQETDRSWLWRKLAYEKGAEK